MRISDWSSDVCSSDLLCAIAGQAVATERGGFSGRDLGRRNGRSAKHDAHASRECKSLFQIHPILLAERSAWPCHLPRCCPEKVIRNRERSLHITIQSQCFIKATQRSCSQIVSIQRRRAHTPKQYS